MAQTKPKAAQFYGVSGNGTAGQVLISDGNGGMSWGSNTEEFTVSWATPTGQGLTYTQPSPQSSVGTAGSTFPTTTFTATKSGEEISGTATIAGLPTGITASQSLSGTGADNVLTVTLTGAFPGADSLNTALTISGLTVQVPIPLTVDYLVVAGGAGGGGVGGGGGAGGYRTNYGGTSLTLLPITNYTVTIGAGGVASATGGSGNHDGGIGSSGGDSVFNTITSAGGGGGAGGGNNGVSGGSGGGARYGTGGSGNTPSVTPSQGNSGHNAVGSAGYGGGGGGAGGSGGANNGGVGTANSITSTSTIYAGGGAGGGGGGTSNGGGGGQAGADNGTNNTGGGGGGGNWTNNSNIALQKGGNGGSGVVILRYPSSYTISGLSGSTDTTTVPGTSITTFTAGTGNIQFN